MCEATSVAYENEDNSNNDSREEQQSNAEWQSDDQPRYPHVP